MEFAISTANGLVYVLDDVLSPALRRFTSACAVMKNSVYSVRLLNVRVGKRN